jgi:uncharacterized protein (DUF2236 family)
MTVRPYLDGFGAMLAGTANVIMQLSRPPVGYGVLESPVESGQVMRHPIKRFRTTFTYLAVALLGTDDERLAYRAAVDTVHRRVRSGPDSPVRYHAMDPDLQLWVAACLYWGTADLYTRMYGPLTEAQADELYGESTRFATTLQVRLSSWPADREAFERYWDDAMAEVSIDPPVREYLMKLVTRSYLPFPLNRTDRFSTFVTTGFLPQRFRDEMGLTWTARDQRRFDTLLRRVGAVQRRMPGPLRRVPFNVLMWDLRLRMRLGRPLV